MFAAAMPAGALAQEGGQRNLEALQIEEVVITAERREDTVQRSSLAITVLNSDQLKIGGVTQANDLQYVVPGLTVSSAGGVVQTYLRGVGSFASNARAEPSIANSINGVYIARPAGIGTIFFDLDRVEVLKGPQGTLYGRNATGGAINLVTNKPAFTFSGNALLEGGDYNAMTGAGYLNVPLGDTFAVRVAGQVAERDGYLSDGYNDQETEAGRLMALWKPSEKFSLLFTGEYAGADGQGEATVPRSNQQATALDPWTGPSDPLSIQPPTAAVPNTGTRIRNDGFNDIDVAAGSLELNWDLGFATLTALPAYRDSDIAYLTYTPGFAYNTMETSEQASMELRLGNSGDKVKWVAGLYYFDEDQTESFLLTASPIQISQVNTTLTTESYAAFGQVTYSLTDTFRVIGGARYSDEDKTQGGISNRLNTAGIVTSSTNNAGQVDFSNVSWKAGAEYDVADESMLFLTVATGFKSGGFVPSVPAPNNTFNEEEITAYTLGSRNRFFDNRFQINLEGFYWEYDDKQERFLSATSNGTSGLLTVNAGQASLYGLSVDMDFKLTANDEFHLGVEYLKSEYDSFKYQLVTANDPQRVGLSPNATDCVLGAPTAGPVGAGPAPSTQSVDCSGLDLVRAPELTGIFGYTRTFNIGSSWQLLSTVYSIVSSDQYLSADFLSNAGEDDGYVLANVDLTLRSRSGRFAISAYGRNLGDEEVYTGGTRYPFSTSDQVTAPLQPGDPTLFYANIAAPRTYGMRVEVGF